jgi:hypothetical protein
VNRFALLALPLVLAAIGCAIAPQPQAIDRVPLTSGARGQIKSMKVVVGTDAQAEQSRWVTQYAGSNPPGAGLIGIIVQTAVMSGLEANRIRQERAVAPIRDAAVKFNFGSHYRSVLEQALRTVQWPRTTSVLREPSLQLSNRQAHLWQMTEDALLISDAFYELAPDFSKLSVTSEVVIYPKQTSTDKSPAITYRDQPDAAVALYRNRFRFEYHIEDTLDAAGAEKWSADSARTFSSAMNVGASEVVRMILLDLQENTPMPSPSASTVTYGRCVGRPLEESAACVVVRTENGELCTWMTKNPA